MACKRKNEDNESLLTIVHALRNYYLETNYKNNLLIIDVWSSNRSSKSMHIRVLNEGVFLLCDLVPVFHQKVVISNHQSLLATHRQMSATHRPKGAILLEMISQILCEVWIFKAIVANQGGTRYIFALVRWELTVSDP